MEVINQKAFIKTFFIGLLIMIVSALIGAGIYVNFIKPGSNTNNSNTNLNNNKNKSNTGIPVELTNTEYKTFDSKHSIKITSDSKIYIDEKEIKEQSDRIIGNKYMQIFVDFVPSSNYITGMTFILDKENKVIVEQNVYEAGQEDINAFGEYAKFSARSGLKLITVNNLDFMTFESEGPTEVYTTSWKKLGWFIGDSVKSDEYGLYVCSSHDDNFNCLKESKYDVDGNKID